MDFISCNGIVLHAGRIGDPGKPAIVFANSLGTDARIWDAVIPFLAERYSFVLYDKRGHGLSDAPRGPYRIADHAADLMALLDAMRIDRFALVGLSVGGMIAQTIAAGQRDRVAALVLCDTAAKIGDTSTWDARIEAVEYKGLESIATSVLERWFTRPYRSRETAAMAGWRNMLTRQPPGGYAATCAAIRDADLRAVAATIAVPTLCLVGDGDLSTPPDLVRGTADLIPNSRFAVIEGAGHIPCVEQPKALADLILGHLAEAGWT
ncbi:MAG: 3-oxoadipate enol-lactonase [Parafilimonas terrae]|nr:3-oxoadipate enol-lactonase [Parafilimonas terrae]